MAKRLATLLGTLTVGVVVVIAGAILPASADLIFGATNAAGDCIAHVPAIPVGICASGVSLTPTEDWTSPSGVTVASKSFLKVGATPINQFLVPDTDESGIGIAPPFGGPDNEINPANFASLMVTNPVHSFTGTISVDSLQTGEQARICSEPDATTFGGTTANCEVTALNSTVNQVLPTPPGYSAGDPWIAVDALAGDVKISDLDVALPVPEPGTAALLLIGIAGLVLVRRRVNLF